MRVLVTLQRYLWLMIDFRVMASVIPACPWHCLCTCLLAVNTSPGTEVCFNTCPLAQQYHLGTCRLVSSLDLKTDHSPASRCIWRETKMWTNREVEIPTCSRERNTARLWLVLLNGVLSLILFYPVFECPFNLLFFILKNYRHSTR